jgi:hypothetical protein
VTVIAKRNYYRGYRGRRTKGKIALAVLLLLVILAAVAVILLQKHVVYDETGAPRLDVPWQEEPAEEITKPELDLVIQEPEVTTEKLIAFSVGADQLAISGIEAAKSEADPRSNAVAILLKDRTGAALTQRTTDETYAVLAELADTYHLIGRLSAFHDPKAAMADVEGMGLKNTGGFIFYDGNNSQWIDPAKPAARAYLCTLAAEAAELGVDEILLTEFGYPTVGKLDKIAYGDAAKNANLLAFLEELQTVLEPYGTVISVELPADVIRNGQDEVAGLVLEEILSVADRVYASVLPEEVEELSAAVLAVQENALFVPVLTEADPALDGNFLIS